MKITISKKVYDETIAPKISKDTFLFKTAEAAFIRDGEFRYDTTRVGLEELEAIYNIAKKEKSITSQLTPIIKMKKDPGGTPTSLKAFMAGLYEFLKRDAIDGWLYEVTDGQTVLPYLVEKVVFHDAIKRSGEEERERVEIKLVANRDAKQRRDPLHTRILNFNSDNIRKKTVAQSLLEHGFYKEDDELKEKYLTHIKLFGKYQGEYGKQFTLKESQYRDSDYYYRLEVIPPGSGVNDEDTINRILTTTSDPTRWRENGFKEGFEEIPIHPYIYIFHLQVHKYVWVHVENMKPYEYDETLREKLVLPQTHRDLIDILVQHMNVLLDDVIKGKSGGTSILCTGEPGLGKTLTAEVYAEIMKKPLYKVQSGQLGLRSDDVEKNFKEILQRAARWGAILLIDEADVYIRKRGNDLQHNALVAAILRTLEYFDGLLFMTTNRGEDVDDAILSRCIAVIKYTTPTPEAAKRIWQVLATQFKAEMSGGLINQLVDTFPKVSGRDIKELLKLAMRFAIAKEKELDLEIFRQCAQFRGITTKEIHEEVVN